MKVLTESSQIKRFFPNHSKKIIINFLLLINCIIQSRTVCLYKCKNKVAGILNKKSKVKANSHYTRLIRFFKMELIGEFIRGIRKFLVHMADIAPIYIIMDRTNWKIGSKNVNLLTIGGLLSGAFVPLHWIQLNKGGASSIEDRKRVLDHFLALLRWAGKPIKGLILLADREFIGLPWLKYLEQLQVSFVIRLRSNMYGELSTFTGKKNFTPLSMQTCSSIWNLCLTHVPARPYLYLCHREKSQTRKEPGTVFVFHI